MKTFYDHSNKKYEIKENYNIISAKIFICYYNSTAQTNPIDPYRYIATLRFDGTDNFDGGETNYPMSFKFNTTQDANSDGVADPEDNLENYVRFAIGDSICGTGRTGLPDRGPNDQRPALYFHYFKALNYDVYEYWLYYPDNDWLNDHEHDWEKYYVYVQDTVPVYLKLSNHISFNTYSWCEITKDNNHPYIGIDGGSHAIKTSDEDGVRIRYNGEITKNNGDLIFGDSLTIPWIIYSNDPGVINSVPYVQSPDTFLYGDPEYFTNSDEYGSPNPAPWMREEWDDPPSVPVVYLGPDTLIYTDETIELDAGSGYSQYLWNDGSEEQTLLIDGSVTGQGVYYYYVIVTDDYGCTGSDTIIITVDENTVSAGLYELDPQINIYPNPSTGKINININNTMNISILNIEIEEICGRRQMLYESFDPSSCVIDLTGQPEGIYLVRLICKNVVKIKKLILN
ncbi:MAG: T9SS type A sorting domain-containing protein [Bacteroidetes bacterium]|nr:T9SS type A sorting domain-containing protein [Bacteroidota bacterium]